jgi:hypothetical protein
VWVTEDCSYGRSQDRDGRSQEGWPCEMGERVPHGLAALHQLGWQEK